VRPVRGGDGALRFEIHRIWGHRPHGKLPAKEYLVQWKGYDTSQMTWSPGHGRPELAPGRRRRAGTPRDCVEAVC
jgi:hypothetical protein